MDAETGKVREEITEAYKENTKRKKKICRRDISRKLQNMPLRSRTKRTYIIDLDPEIKRTISKLNKEIKELTGGRSKNWKELPKRTEYRHIAFSK